MKLTDFLPLATDPKEKKTRKPNAKKVESLRNEALERLELLNKIKSQNNG